MTTYKSQVALSLMPSFNNALCCEFINRLGGIDAMFKENENAYNALCREYNYQTRSYNRSEALKLLDKELKAIEDNEISICCVEDDKYPALLSQIVDHPLVFYYKGDIDFQASTTFLSIVGTRNSSSLYRDRVTEIVSYLSRCSSDIIIVSGLAYGIDAASHKAALDNKLRTFSVLGHGLDKVYPSTHINLSKDILTSAGALISEFPCSLGIHGSNFLKRNRIVAGLSLATLVAESAIKGGSMTTARLALSYDREVYALPGRPNDKCSSGCNMLIKQNVAYLVENGEDVALMLKLKEPLRESPQQLSLFEDDPDMELLYDIIKEKGQCSVDELFQLSCLSHGKVLGLTLQLEMQNRITCLPGNTYVVKC